MDIDEGEVDGKGVVEGKDEDDEVGGTPWKHQHLLIAVPMDQHWTLRGALVKGS